MVMSTGIHNHQTGSGPQNNYNAVGTQNINTFNTASQPLKTLSDAVAGVGASHNAEQQYSRGECLPGTREKVIGSILEWILAKELPICWLSGTAGVGKTAIAMTVAKAVKEEGRLVCSFFFFRSDPRRNNPSALVLSIAHGLGVTNPSYRILIDRRILDDPKILEARMEEQFRELVVKPHGRQTPAPLPQKSQKPSFCQKWSGRIQKALGKCPLMAKDLDRQGSADDREVPDLVIIDGLDECGDERTQKRILSMIQSTFLTSPDFPLRFLICSRPEAWLQEAFTANSLSRLSKSILLNEEFRPAEDIVKFYRHQFQEIVSDPKYRQIRFPHPWPTEEDLETLVEKSCSQFVYAATVSRFIADTDDHPVDQLRLILESNPNSQPGASPYKALDTLYNIILTANRNPDKVCPILAAIVILSEFMSPTPASIELILGLPEGQVAVRLWGMHSVLYIGGWDDWIAVHHTSFREYLVDPNRSRNFHIDVDTQKYAIARQWLLNLTTSKVLTYSPSQLYSKGTKAFFYQWFQLCTSIPKPSRDLLDDLWNVDIAPACLWSLNWGKTFEKLVQWVREY
ncbi:hypothetical protein AAF712_009829, partial [Marasmius tenuissimus]